jgi:hypothetical protein
MATVISSITPIQGGITVFGNKRICIADVVLSSSTWPSGGLALIGSDFGMSAIDTLWTCGGAKANYKWSSNVLQAYVSTIAGAAMALATGLDVSETIRVVAIGYGLK